jgi:hypothetical protein
MSRYPIFINCRDRLSPLLDLLSWLERAGHTRIHLVDNGSTYPPLLAFYKTTTYRVVALDANLGSRAPWESGLIDDIAADDFYVVTDPDIVPVPECPPDAVAHFHSLLDRYPDRIKVGFGLKIDDLPTRYRHSAEVQGWEERYWRTEIEPGVYDADIDTTFALYRPGAPVEVGPGLRTGEPYLARHTGWYVNSRRLGAEERYYRRHALGSVTSWGKRKPSPYLYEPIRPDSEQLREMSVAERVDRLDLSLFDHIVDGVTTTYSDRRSLLALHAGLATRGEFRYLEIGAAHGETLQAFVADPRCRAITAIDRHARMSAHKCDERVHQPPTASKDLPRRLEVVPKADIAKLTPVNGNSEGLDLVDVRADLCLIDGTHITDDTALRDARFCQEVIRGRGVIVFYRWTAVLRGIRRFLGELPRHYQIYPLKHDLLVIEIGIRSLLPESAVRPQIRPAWYVASRLRLVRLALRVREVRRVMTPAHRALAPSTEDILPSVDQEP